MPRASFNISLPAEMALEVEAAMKREHRTRSELVREALRVYFAMTARPSYTPTAKERRAIASGRAELRKGSGLTLEEFHAELDRLDRAEGSKGRPVRTKTRTQAAATRAR